MNIKKLIERPAKSGTIGYVLKSGMPPQDEIKRVNSSILIALVFFAIIVGYAVGHL